MLSLEFYSRIVANISDSYGENQNDLVRWAEMHFSQNGEDVAVRNALWGQEKNKGIYVDIGAFHPIKYSNTFLLYLLGWRGVNVDPNVEAIELFRKLRPNEVSLNVAISTTSGTAHYTYFEDPAFNTIVIGPEPPVSSTSKYLKTVEVPCWHINDLLEQVVGDKKFDFLNLDIEGLDLQVLKSIDFTRFKPLVICAEIDRNLAYDSDFKEFLNSIGYTFYALCGNGAVLSRLELKL